jgi:hybrid cluster-associated redox disulfide protein
MPRITMQTTIADALAGHPLAATAFVSRAMACPGCPLARFETIADAVREYAVDGEALLEALRCPPVATAAARRKRRR